MSIWGMHCRMLRIASVDSDGIRVFDSQSAELLYIATSEAVFHPDQLSQDIPIRKQATPDGPNWQPFYNESHIANLWRSHLPEFLPSSVQDAGMKYQRIAFAPNRKIAAFTDTTKYDLTVRPAGREEGVGLLFFGAGAGLPQLLLSPDDEWIRTLSFSPDSCHLATAGDLNSIFIWDMSTEKLVSEFGTPPPAVTAIDIAPSGELAAVGTNDATVWLIDLNVPSVLAHWRFPQSSPSQFTSRSCSIGTVRFGGEQELVVLTTQGAAVFLSVPDLTPVLEWQCQPMCLGGCFS